MPTDKYNPNAPQIIGNEFVGIRDEDLTFDPFANTFERGFEFQFDRSQNLDAVRCYLNTFPPKFFQYGCLTASIYPQGAEAESGPVRSVIIPCNNGIVTGDAGGLGFSAIGFGGGATSAASALWNPSGLQYMEVRVGELYRSAASLFFAVDQYAQLLDGKRILGVDFLTTVDMGTTLVNGGNDQGYIYLTMENTAGITMTGGLASSGGVLYSRLVTPVTPASALEFVRVHLGDVNRFYGVPAANPLGNHACRQWTYPELQRFEQGASGRLAMRIVTPPVGVQSGSSNVLFSYAALEVFYCEERRVGFGTTIFQDDDTSVSVPLRLGATGIGVRSPRGDTIIVSPGNYTVTLSQSNMGDAEQPTLLPMSDAKFNALRVKEEDYAPQVVPGLQVNLPYPLNEEAIGQTMTTERSMVLPQLSLHASGSVAGFIAPLPFNGTLIQSHVYGRQSVGQVYTTSSPAYVVQNIYATLAGASRSYSWLRVWVRRFGNTIGSLRVQVAITPGSTYTNSITVEEFDALDEVIDGWKEVNFDFTSNPVLMGSTTTSGLVTFTSQPELSPGNRWEVLGCAAPAVSGLPGNQLNLVLPPHTLTLPTYGEPVSGAVINETWLPQLGPYVSGATADQTADLSFMFSQTQLAVTGFSVLTGSQAVTGIGEGCDGAPCCIPTHILYNELSWGLPPNTSYVLDTFSDDAVSSWGVTDTGQTWSAPSSGAASQANVSGGVATFAASAASTFRFMTLPNIGTNFDITTTTYVTNASPLNPSWGVVGRYTDADNWYEARISVNSTSGQASFSINKTVATAFSVLAFVVLPFEFAFSSYSKVNIRFMGYDTFLKAKIWNINDPEPEHWTIETSDSSLTTGSAVGIDILNADATTTQAFDDFTVKPPAGFFGYYELQRMDTVETDWQTIMKASDPSISSFNDYEARIGIETSYRIRTTDLYEFPGTWSSTVTTTLPTPGISGGDCVMDGHILVFTSNEHQDGAINLAYASVWMDATVAEDFNFPEANFVQLQPMYDRNFFTAFRPSERGGEAFVRTVLVQAAAIAPETLADFRSLRDMAWDSVNYVCVRDEDGNRWFATVLVPDGRVLRDRRLYLASVGITEVTQTPTPVDPAV